MSQENLVKYNLVHQQMVQKFQQQLTLLRYSLYFYIMKFVIIVKMLYLIITKLLLIKKQQDGLTLLMVILKIALNQFLNILKKLIMLQLISYPDHSLTRMEHFIASSSSDRRSQIRAPLQKGMMLSPAELEPAYYNNYSIIVLL